MITEQDKEEALQYALRHPGMGVDHAGRCYMGGLLAERSRPELKDFIDAVEDYLENRGNHAGPCDNEDEGDYPEERGPCFKHIDANKSREARVATALQKLKETHNV